MSVLCVAFTSCQKETETPVVEEMEELAQFLVEHPELGKVEGYTVSAKSGAAGLPAAGDNIRWQLHKLDGEKTTTVTTQISQVYLGQGSFIIKTLGVPNSSYFWSGYNQVLVQTDDCAPDYPANIFATLPASANINVGNASDGYYNWKNDLACSNSGICELNVNPCNQIAPNLVMGKDKTTEVLFVTWE